MAIFLSIPVSRTYSVSCDLFSHVKAGYPDEEPVFSQGRYRLDDILFWFEDCTLYQIREEYNYLHLEQGDMFITRPEPMDKANDLNYVKRNGTSILTRTHTIRPSDEIIGGVTSTVKFFRTPQDWQANLRNYRAPALIPKEGFKNLDLADFLTEGKKDTLFMTVMGDSMIDAGIAPKDLVLINRQLSWRSGDVVMAEGEDGHILKRLKIEPISAIKDVVLLISENTDYPPRKTSFIRGDEYAVHIYGPAVATIKLYYPLPY
jgi:phage repressor protein C with HTH and peptisase S24 domain